jgi:hypothetical protein
LLAYLSGKERGILLVKIISTCRRFAWRRGGGSVLWYEQIEIERQRRGGLLIIDPVLTHWYLSAFLKRLLLRLLYPKVLEAGIEGSKLL